MTDALEQFKQVVQRKEWFADDDHLTIADDPAEHLWWTTESYIANTQIVAVVNDVDVDLGVIDPDEETYFKIALYPTYDYS